MSAFPVEVGKPRMHCFLGKQVIGCVMKGLDKVCNLFNRTRARHRNSLSDNGFLKVHQVNLSPDSKQH